MRDITTNRYWFDLLFLLHLIIVKWTDIVHSYWKGGWGGLRYYRNITYSRYELWWPVFHMAISMNFDAVSITNSIEWNVAISMLVWGGGGERWREKREHNGEPQRAEANKKEPNSSYHIGVHVEATSWEFANERLNNSHITRTIIHVNALSNGTFAFVAKNKPFPIDINYAFPECMAGNSHSTIFIGELINVE